MAGTVKPHSHIETEKMEKTAPQTKGLNQSVTYEIRILHIRPEISPNSDFLLTYCAKDERGEKYLEETFTKAFKSAHPGWIIKKVTVKPKADAD